MYRTISRSALGAGLVLAAALGASPLGAQTTFRACRVPSVGAIYMIGVAGAPSACLDPNHVEFSWTEGGAAGPGSVGTTELADGAVTDVKIAADAVTSASIANATIVAADLANNSVTAAKIAANAVGTSEIADQSVSTADIAEGAVTQAKLDPAISIPLGPDAVTSANILDGTIVAADIANNSLTAAKIAGGAVGTSEIADGAVAAADLNSSLVTARGVALVSATGTLLRGINATDVARSGTGVYRVTFNFDAQSTGYYLVTPAVAGGSSCVGMTPNVSTLGTNTVVVYSETSGSVRLDCPFSLVVF
jgi:hypothetical protein